MGAKAGIDTEEVRLMPGRVSGKIAVVIGAGQTPGSSIGNGRAIALLFGREGAHVECVDLFSDRAEETAAQIREEGGAAGALQMDVSDLNQVQKGIAAILTRHGRIDMLVNNVGILARNDGEIDGIAIEAYERVLAVNTRSVLLTTQAVLPIMRKQQTGAIVNISSAAAEWGGFHLAYEVSKAAVNRLTTSTAQSQSRYGIRCNTVQLGLMDTPMAINSVTEKSGQSEVDVRANRNSRVPLLGQQGTGWDAAWATLFLASDEARFITGATLVVDGGTGVRAMF
jgi:NAD(P)-dependent dehydrogenase (short-subunit alcohol dehydrogenase family)